MYSNFDYVKIDPQYFFIYLSVLDYFIFFARLLKKNIEEVKCRF
jgi:hypothetical protein